MLNLFFSTVLAIAVVGVSLKGITTENAGVLNNTQANDEHHTCSGSATLGGTCSATCQDSQNCSCSTGLVSCHCSCTTLSSSFSTPDVSNGYPVTPEQHANWGELGGILQSENSQSANNAYSQLTYTYQLLNNGELNAFAANTDTLRDLLRNQSTSLRNQINTWLASKGADERF